MSQELECHTILLFPFVNIDQNIYKVKLHEMKIVKKQYLDVLIHNKITNFEAFWWNILLGADTHFSEEC